MVASLSWAGKVSLPGWALPFTCSGNHDSNRLADSLIFRRERRDGRPFRRLDWDAEVIAPSLYIPSSVDFSQVRVSPNKKPTNATNAVKRSGKTRDALQSSRANICEIGTRN